MHIMRNMGTSFMYEGLARAVFDNCNKYGDPFGLAAQDIYNNEFVPAPTVKGKRALSTVIIKMIIDHPNSEEVKVLRKIDDALWSASSQEEAINIIEQCIEIGERLGY